MAYRLNMDEADTVIKSAMTGAVVETHNEELAELQRRAYAKIQQIQSSDLSAEDKARLISVLTSAIDTGTVQSLSAAVIGVTAIASVQEAENNTATTALMQEYLFEDEAARVATISSAFNLHDRRAVEKFAGAIVDQDISYAMRVEQRLDLTNAIMNDPQIAAHLQAASKPAREAVSSAYIHGQRDFKDLENNAVFADAKETLEKADHLGLEANADVQKLLKAAKENKLTAAELNEQLKPFIHEQKEKICIEMRDALQTVPADVREKAMHFGSEKKITEAALEAFRRSKDPSYQMSDDEKAAVRVFALSKNTLVTKVLGDNALTIDKGISLERDSGTIEQRTERAMKVLQEHMPPELAELAQKRPDVLKKMVQESLEQADQKKLNVSQIDTLKGADLDAFSSAVTNGVREDSAQWNRAMEAAKGANLATAGVSGGEPSSPAENKVADATTAKQPQRGEAQIRNA